MRDDDFCVERRVCVDMSKIRATKKLSRGFEPHSIKLVQGMLLNTIIKRAIFCDISNHKNQKLEVPLGFKIPLILRYEGIRIVNIGNDSLKRIANEGVGPLCKMHISDLALMRFTHSLSK